jgi:aspartyl-tRNA synthetase
VARSDETEMTDLPTGHIEVQLAEVNVEVLRQPMLPLPVNSDAITGEDIRLRYRYLDLRREKVAQEHPAALGHHFQHSPPHDRGQGFMEFQTPILTASSPEGARDFLVPSRLHPGKFYALPQAPQQFKQLIMVAGFDRYFQIAPCFRDEDARADRSPGEFYQLDIEMSFATQDDVFNAIEPVIARCVRGIRRFQPEMAGDLQPFPRIAYADSMLKYGNDKPDLRNPLKSSPMSPMMFPGRTSRFSPG